MRSVNALARALRHYHFAGDGCLDEEDERPLIKLAGAGINRADLLQVEGHHPPPPGAPDTPGLECAGTVAAVGAAVTEARVGDGVCALLAGGGYAEYAVASEACLLPVPKGVSPVDAGGLAEVYFTVWSNVFDTVHLKPGESFLVHGGSIEALSDGPGKGATFNLVIPIQIAEERARAYG